MSRGIDELILSDDRDHTSDFISVYTQSSVKRIKFREITSDGPTERGTSHLRTDLACKL